MHPREQATSTIPIPGDQRTRIRETLERILASPAFRNSKQCQAFLRYVIEHSHRGEDEMLRERNIGIEVFDRAPDYDTAEDPVVRVRANEIRKRLAQYYQDSASADDVRFEIPAGCYRAEYHFPPPGSQPAVPVSLPTRTPRRWRIAVMAAFCVTLLAGAAVFFARRPAPATAVDQFWAPVLASPKPVLLYCGQPVVYFLSPEVHASYRATVPPDRRRGSYSVLLAPEAPLRGRDIIPVIDQFVGIGNAHTAALLSALFAVKGKPVEIRYANDLSFSDLRSSPSVLIGAFSNLWTLEMTGQLRFVFEQQDGVRRIRDRSRDQTWQLRQLAPDGKTPEDYAIVSRLFDSATGQLLISAAGITQYGTRAAGEFLTSEARMREAVAKAPAAWPGRNLQVLLHTAVYKGTPAPPRVIATQVW